MGLLILILILLMVDHVWGHQPRQLPGPPAPEWQQWAVFFFCLASVYVTMFAARGCFGQ